MFYRGINFELKQFVQNPELSSILSASLAFVRFFRTAIGL